MITVDPSRRLKDALGLDALVERAATRRARRRRGAARRAGARHQAHLRSPDRAASRRAPPSPSASSPTASIRSCRASSAARPSTWRWRSCTSCCSSDRYELIVVDTPPSADVRELLAAPLRMTELLASQAVRVPQGAGVDHHRQRIGPDAHDARGGAQGAGALDRHDAAARAVGLRRRLRAARRRLPRPRRGDRARRCARPTPASRSSTTPEPNTIAATLDFDARAARRRLPGRRDHRQPRLRLPAARRAAGACGSAQRCARSCCANYARLRRARRARPRRAATRCRRETGTPLLADRAGDRGAAGVDRRPAPHRGAAASARSQKRTRTTRHKSKGQKVTVTTLVDFCLVPSASLSFRLDARLRLLPRPRLASPRGACRTGGGARRGGACWRFCCAAIRRSSFMLRLTMLPCSALDLGEQAVVVGARRHVQRRQHRLHVLVDGAFGVDGALDASCRAARARAGSCRAPRGRRRPLPRRARTARTASTALRCAARAWTTWPIRYSTGPVGRNRVVGRRTRLCNRASLDQPAAHRGDAVAHHARRPHRRRHAVPPLRPQQRLPKNLWTTLGFVFGIWAVAVLLVLPKRERREPAEPVQPVRQ